MLKKINLVPTFSYIINIGGSGLVLNVMPRRVVGRALPAEHIGSSKFSGTGKNC